MATETARFVINRVVIALDSVCDYLAPIEAAADLAGRLHAELHGVFVEDMDLLRVADLPFTRQVALGRQSTRPLERDAIESEFRALARQARRCLQRIAVARQITWSFEVVKSEGWGYTPPTTDNELLVMESRTRAFAGHVRLPARRQVPVAAGWRATALLGPAKAKTPKVVAVVDDSPAAERVLEAAFDLAGGDNKSLTVFCKHATVRWLLAHAGERANVPTIRDLDELNAARLRVLLREVGAGVAVVPLSLAHGEDGPLSDLLSDPPCTIVLVA